MKIMMWKLSFACLNGSLIQEPWPDEDGTLMLQRIFKSKAQETSSALSSGAWEDYDLVKSAVLEAYAVVL